MSSRSPHDWCATVEGTVRRIVRLAMQGRLTEDEAVGAAMAKIRDLRANVTTKAAEAEVGHRLLARHDELIAKGHREHNAAMMVAREFGEPHEWETIADRVRRLRSKRAKRAA